jgi:uncharacterized membrane protein
VDYGVALAAGGDLRTGRLRISNVARFTRAIVALWAIFGIAMLALGLLVEPPGDWPGLFSGMVPLMLRAGVVLAVVWGAGYLGAWAWGKPGAVEQK